jgi:hypothetical protein
MFAVSLDKDENLYHPILNVHYDLCTRAANKSSRAELSLSLLMKIQVELMKHFELKNIAQTRLVSI